MDTHEGAPADGRSAAKGLDPESRRQLFTQAAAADCFTEEPVSDSALHEVWAVAKAAPTPTNTQPLRVLYVRDGAGRARLVNHMHEGNRAKTRSAPAVAVLASDTRFHEHSSTIWPDQPELRAIFAANGTARRKIASFNAALQAGYFLLAVRACGLAAEPMSGFDPSGIDAEFFSDRRYRSILVVGIGHPPEKPRPGRLPRLGHEDVVGWA